MSELDDLIKTAKANTSGNILQTDDKYRTLLVLSNIAYYVGIALLPLAVVLFIMAASGEKDYIAGISMGCLLGGINGLFFGLIGKCLIDIYNKVNQNK
ncbi:hypothetical protein C7120_09045 [Prevotella sp. oral taxon 376]|uniref:hypothetical protein n=1 Tax=Prevotella sp. oral taxon 376 TaxID=712466 RepID=UPI000D1DFBA7|nr:hypothetical protein [Prevotella sp. oral taxon 376]PTL34636.1 hypothetical protein C7120_09045 [Prevotella sp. oral taxon 376]